jgi:hypothetical protein
LKTFLALGVPKRYSSIFQIVTKPHLLARAISTQSNALFLVSHFLSYAIHPGTKSKDTAVTYFLSGMKTQASPARGTFTFQTYYDTVLAINNINTCSANNYNHPE